MVLVKSLLLGLALTAGTVGLHAFGTTWWIATLQRFWGGRREAKSTPRAVLALSATAIFLLLLHLAEVALWAAVYLAIPSIQSLTTIEEAVYFSTVVYTTLGLGDVVIAESWRLLSAIQSMAGLLIFGWSTALLYAVVRRVWEADSRVQGDRDPIGR